MKTHCIQSIPRMVMGGLAALLFLASTFSLVAQSKDRNYVITRTMTNEEGTQYIETIQYFDGLGRPDVKVEKGITPSGRDLVHLQQYDEFARASTSWLPGISEAKGAYVLPETIMEASKSLNSNVRPYTQPEYEASPLSRILKQHMPGGYNTQTSYHTNSTTDKKFTCRLYQVEGTQKIVSKGNYNAGELYITEFTDESSVKLLEFKDKSGRLVLRRQVESTTAMSPYLDTYYVYDDFGNICFMLSPEASERMQQSPSVTSWTIDSEVIKTLCYYYLYDGRNRCYQKGIPGCEAVYYVYDKSDKLIFIQDGEMRNKGEWYFTIPDALGRVVVTGTCKNTISPVEDYLKDVAVRASFGTSSYTFRGYSVSGVSLQSPTLYEVNYYDDYSFMGVAGNPSAIDADYKLDNQPTYGQPYMESQKGLLTGRYTNAGSGNVEVYYYDYKGRVIQSKESNAVGGHEKMYYKYNFTGQPLQVQHIHYNAYRTNQTEIYKYTYDHAGRHTHTTHQFNSGNIRDIEHYTYDDLGRISTSQFFESLNLKVDYTYHVRGWIRDISNPLFKEALTFKPNGNIATRKWGVNLEKEYEFSYDPANRLVNGFYSENGVRSHDNSVGYQYDKNGNIKHIARESQITGPGNSKLVDNLTISHYGNQMKTVKDAATSYPSSTLYDFKDYSANDPNATFTYNANGSMEHDPYRGINITYDKFQRPQKVEIPAIQGTITYSYTPDGTRLSKTSTWNPDLSLNPLENTGTGSSNRLTTTYYYAKNKIYNQSTLEMILIPGGYYDVPGKMYYFYIRDYQGNNCIVANQNGILVQQTNYYPFGMPMQVATNPERQPFKYSGKEFDTMHGINLYDFHARQQYPALGIFTSVDPLAEKYPWVSPYAYCLNNPLRYIDPDGREIRLREVYKNDNTNYPVARIGFSVTTEAAMKDYVSTDLGRSFMAQFANAGDVVGGHTFDKNGSLSNHTLTIWDYSYSEESRIPFVDSGTGSYSFNVDPQGKATITIKVVSYNADKYTVGEVITHENHLHGYQVNDHIKNKSTTTETQDHKALKNNNIQHKGYNEYKSVQKQLENKDKKYERAFEDAQREAKKIY